MLRVPTALHLPIVHDDDITRHLANCDKNYKFAAYQYSILQEFVLDNKVIVTRYLETVRKLHIWRTGSDRILKRSASVTYEFDISWDPGVGPAFIGDDLPCYATCILFELPLTAAGLSQKSVSLPPPWFNHDVLVLILRPPPWPD